MSPKILDFSVVMKILHCFMESSLLGAHFTNSECNKHASLFKKHDIVLRFQVAHDGRNAAIVVKGD